MQLGIWCTVSSAQLHELPQSHCGDSYLSIYLSIYILGRGIILVWGKYYCYLATVAIYFVKMPQDWYMGWGEKVIFKLLVFV